MRGKKGILKEINANSMKPTRLILVRQGGTQWHDQDQLVGQKNAELSLPGLARAEKAAQLLRTEKIDRVFSSNLGRAIDTAKVIAKYHRLRVIPDADLNERGYGALEGKKRKDLVKELKRLHHQLEEKPEGGESRYHFDQRVVGGLEEILKQNEGKTIVIVSHEGPIRVIQRYFTRFDTTKGDDDYRASLGGISEFEVTNLDPLAVAVKKWDAVEHLN